MGLITMHSTDGSITGPPAEREYAVEPVGVEKISPSARYWLTGFPSQLIVRSIIRESDPRERTTSLRAA
jgi:hypothetical protein